MDKDIVTVQSDYIVNLCAIQQEDMLAVRLVSLRVQCECQHAT